MIKNIFQRIFFVNPNFSFKNMHSKYRLHNFSHIGRTLMYWMLQTAAAAQVWYKSVTEDREEKWLSNPFRYYLQFSCLLKYYNQNTITHISICVFTVFVFDTLTDLYMWSTGILDTPITCMAIDCDWWVYNFTLMYHTTWERSDSHWHVDRFIYQCKICVTGPRVIPMTATQPCEAWGDW